MFAPVEYLLWGIGFGLLLSAPVGPVNVICLRRALLGRSVDGFLIGMGAAAGDALYAGLAAFGLTAVFHLIESHVIILKIIGGMIMLVFAYRIWVSHPHLDAAPPEGGVIRGMLGAFIVTVTNPGVFLAFLGLYSLTGLVGGDVSAPEKIWNSAALVMGVFAGAALWWFTLVSLTRFWREKITDKFLEFTNHVSAGLVGAFAVLTLASTILPQ